MKIRTIEDNITEIVAGIKETDNFESTDDEYLELKLNLQLAHSHVRMYENSELANILKSNVSGFQKEVASRKITRSYRNDVTRTHIIRNIKSFCVICVKKKQSKDSTSNDKQHKLKHPVDIIRRCTLCGEDLSEEILHFFVNCCCAYQIVM